MGTQKKSNRGGIQTRNLPFRLWYETKATEIYPSNSENYNPLILRKFWNEFWNENYNPLILRKFGNECFSDHKKSRDQA